MSRFIPIHLPAFWVVTLITAGLNAIITMGVYFSNSAGALSACHAALAGMGAYLGAVLTTNFEWPFPVALLAGALIGFAIGMLLALMTLHMNELVAGLTTLAFGETMVIIAFNLDYIGGANGFIGIPLETTFDNVYLLLALLVFAAWRFDRSRLGYAARACRDNAHAAAAMGINTPWVKTLVFALGSGIAGLGGVLRAHYVLVQNPDDMGFFFSVNYLIFWVFGGSYTFWGPVFGALFLTILPELLRFSLYDRFIIYGVILTAIVIVRLQGVITRVPLGRQPAFVAWLSRLWHPRRPIAGSEPG
jgi:branched-chain amino acid transport system permease protein